MTPEDTPLLCPIEDGTHLRSGTTDNLIVVKTVKVPPMGETVVKIEEKGAGTRELTVSDLKQAMRDGRILPHSYEIKQIHEDREDARWGKEHKNGDVTRVEVQSWQDNGFTATATDVVNGDETASQEVGYAEEWSEVVYEAEKWMARNPAGVAPDESGGGGGSGFLGF
jgi:hypothetical protein